MSDNLETANQIILEEMEKVLLEMAENGEIDEGILGDLWSGVKGGAKELVKAPGRVVAAAKISKIDNRLKTQFKQYQKAKANFSSQKDIIVSSAQEKIKLLKKLGKEEMLIDMLNDDPREIFGREILNNLEDEELVDEVKNAFRQALRTNEPESDEESEG